MLLLDIWESTSFSLEKLQCNPVCVLEEQQGLFNRTGPTYKLTFDIQPIKYEILNNPLLQQKQKHKIAVIRQEGSNGDREMLSAFHSAGFESWDVNMRDLVVGNVSLDVFRGIVFCGCCCCCSCCCDMNKRDLVVVLFYLKYFFGYF